MVEFSSASLAESWSARAGVRAVTARQRALEAILRPGAAALRRALEGARGTGARSRHPQEVLHMKELVELTPPAALVPMGPAERFSGVVAKGLRAPVGPEAAASHPSRGVEGSPAHVRRRNLQGETYRAAVRMTSSSRRIPNLVSARGRFTGPPILGQERNFRSSFGAKVDALRTAFRTKLRWPRSPRMGISL